jgi:transcriptional regulator with XRE-family HTH domain
MQDIRVLVGKRIRSLRKDAGLSQEALGLKAGLDRTYIASVEGGKRNISIVNVEKLSLSLGRSLTEFFDVEDFSADEKRFSKIAEKSNAKYR